MRILVDPGSFDSRNWGDVAMLRTAILRLRDRWPHCRLQVLTSDAAALAAHSPEAEAVADAGRRAWFADRTLLGRLHASLPSWSRRAVASVTRGLRRRSPGAFEALLRRRLESEEARRSLGGFLEALRGADLYVVAGQASINDLFPGHARALLDTLEEAQARGLATVLFSQGLGPLSDSHLRARARAILPGAVAIVLREARHGAALLEQLSVPRAVIAVSGDDAVEIAAARAGAAPGSDLGVNLRATPPAGLDAAALAPVGRGLADFARRRGAGLTGVPIAFHDDARDAEMTKTAVGEARGDWSPAASLDDAIGRARRCRVVVTSAYHAAVFALSQGIPALGLGGSRFSRERFEGLAELFGEGCRYAEVGSMGDGGAGAAALEELWSRADELFGPLRAAAQSQVDAGRAAVARLAGVRREAA
jgi:polysaccharide pyruvyl transferase WcaK-like protein